MRQSDSCGKIFSFLFGREAAKKVNFNEEIRVEVNQSF